MMLRTPDSTVGTLTSEDDDDYSKFLFFEAPKRTDGLTDSDYVTKALLYESNVPAGTGSLYR
jgi:hypothetical protein